MLTDISASSLSTSSTTSLKYTYISPSPLSLSEIKLFLYTWTWNKVFYAFPSHVIIYMFYLFIYCKEPGYTIVGPGSIRTKPTGQPTGKSRLVPWTGLKGCPQEIFFFFFSFFLLKKQNKTLFYTETHTHTHTPV